MMLLCFVSDGSVRVKYCLKSYSSNGELLELPVNNEIIVLYI